MILFLIFSLIKIDTYAQCSFEYISNDTSYQDNIEFIYPVKNKDLIIAIGSRINRGIINDDIYNAPVFQIFDYCGNILKNIHYQFIDKYKLNHRPMPTHNTYKEEPIGNSIISLQENVFLMVDRVIDTLSRKPYLILYTINEEGQLLHYNVKEQSIQEANQLAIKNVLKLKDGRILIILWDYAFGYFFNYFDADLNFISLRSYSLGRGIRSIVELGGDEFICSSLAYDNSNFQFYKLDSNGELSWIVTPATVFGLIREIQIKENKLYITGGVMGIGLFLICDLDGNILKEFKYQNFYCQPRFCSSIINSSNDIYISGYIKHCDKEDKKGSDLVLLKIDSNGIINWSNTYDFRNNLGTSGDGGFYTDYGGFSISKTNDGGIITNGMSKYTDLKPGKVLHEDAILIKSKKILSSIDQNKENATRSLFTVFYNYTTKKIELTGPVDSIRDWTIYSINGNQIRFGKSFIGPVLFDKELIGIYFLNISDGKKFNHTYKFLKTN